MRELTERQQQVLGAVITFTAEKGYPPTLRELVPILGLRSTNGVNDHLQALARKGKISGGDFKSRTVTVVPTPDHEKRLDEPVRVGERGWIVNYHGEMRDHCQSVFRMLSHAIQWADRMTADGWTEVFIYSAQVGPAYQRKRVT